MAGSAHAAHLVLVLLCVLALAAAEHEGVSVAQLSTFEDVAKVPMENGTVYTGNVGDGTSYIFNATAGCDYLMEVSISTLDGDTAVQVHVRLGSNYEGSLAVPTYRFTDSATTTARRLFCQSCPGTESFYQLDVLGNQGAQYELSATLVKRALSEGQVQPDTVAFEDGLHFWYFDVDDADSAPLQVSVRDDSATSDGRHTPALLAAVHSSCPVFSGNTTLRTALSYTRLTFDDQAVMMITKRGPPLKKGRWYFVVAPESSKNFTIEASYGMPYATYWYIDIGSLSAFIVLCALIVLPTFLWLRACQPSAEEEEEMQQRKRLHQPEHFDEQGFPYEDEEDELEDPMDEVSLSKLERNCLQYVWRYRSHIQLTALLGLFFGIPAIQTVVAISTMESMGNRDICYFNERCMRPDAFLSGVDSFLVMTWNNLFSNMGYVVVGFMLITYVLLVQIWRRGRPVTMLVPREFSFIWSISIALIFEGIFSAMYHICPTRTIFQFDTVYMFVIAGLIFLELFRKQFGWVWSAWRSAVMLGLLLILNYLGTVADQAYSDLYRYSFKGAVIGGVAITCVLSWTWTLIRVRRRALHQERYTWFWGLISVSLSLCLVLAIIWIFGLSSSNYLLFCVVGSLVIIPFAVHLGFSWWQWWTSKKQRHGHVLAYLGQYTLLFAGTIVTCVSIVYFLGLFWAPTTTNKELTPEASRDLNSDCVLFDYYDAHDVWHYLSALGLMFLVLFIFHADFREAPKRSFDLSYREELLYEAKTYRPIH